jgi:hypothetical protein
MNLVLKTPSRSALLPLAAADAVGLGCCKRHRPGSVCTVDGAGRQYRPLLSRRRPGSGAAWVPTTTGLRLSVSWMNWRGRPARIRLTSAGRCLETSRAFSRHSIWRRKNPIGVERCLRVSGVVSVCSRRLPASSRTLRQQGIAAYRPGRGGVEEANVRMIAGGCR